MKRDSGNTDKYYAMADTLSISLLRLVISIELARLAGPELFAVYVLLLAGEMIWSNVSASMLIVPMLSIAPGLPVEQRQGLMRYMLGRYRYWLVLTAGLGLLLSPIAMLFDLKLLTWLGFCTGLAASIWSGALRGCMQCGFTTRRALAADTCALLIPASGTLLCASWGGDPLTCYYWLYAAGWLLAGSAMSPKQLFTSGDGHHPPPDELVAKIKRMSLPVLTGSVANSACSRSHPYILGLVAGGMQVSLFGAANTLIGPMRMLVMAMNTVLRPRLALYHGRGEYAASRRMLLIVAGLFVLTGAALTVLMSVMGRWLAVLVFGDEFASLGVVLPAASIYATFDAVTTCLMIAMQVQLDRGAVYAARLRMAAAVVSLMLAWPACAMWGVIGSFGVLALCELVYMLLAVILLNRRVNR